MCDYSENWEYEEQNVKQNVLSDFKKGVLQNQSGGM